MAEDFTGRLNLSTIEEWERWIEWRLPEAPRYSWSQSPAESQSHEEMVRGMVSVDFAAAGALLIEILVEMTDPARLAKLRDLVSTPGEGNSKVAILDRAVAVVRARASCVSTELAPRALTAEEADAEIRESQILMLFLHEIAEPEGVRALARAVHAQDDDESSSIRSILYLALVQYGMFAQTVPPVPPALVRQLS